MFEPNDIPSVPTDTDDLDAFSDLLTGKAAPAEPVEKEEAPNPEDDDAEDAENSEDSTETTEQDTDDDTEDNSEDDDTPDEDDTSEEKPKQKTSKVQERINQLLKERREAQEREQAALRKLEEALDKQNDPRNTKQANTAPIVDKEAPSPDDLLDDGSDKYPLGEFDPAYIRDLTRHTIQMEQAAAKQRDEQTKAQEFEQKARDELQNSWVEKLNAVEHEDFLEKTLELESAFDGLDPAYSDYLVQTIKSLDHGPDVLYYFANNLEEANKFVRKGPLEATLALGEINAMFKGTTTKREAKVSKAPPPPQVNKGSKTVKSVRPDTDDLDAFSQILFNKTKGKR